MTSRHPGYPCGVSFSVSFLYAAKAGWFGNKWANLVLNSILSEIKKV
jgi:hypothetical protein